MPREADKIQLYPNPTDGFIHISKGLHNLDQMYLLNSMGARASFKLISEDLLDVNQLPAGLYNPIIGSKGFKFIKR